MKWTSTEIKTVSLIPFLMWWVPHYYRPHHILFSLYNGSWNIH
jgi:hypothetical protein